MNLSLQTTNSNNCVSHLTTINKHYEETLFIIALLTLVLGASGIAQDLVHFAKAGQFPIYLSKSKVLIQYRDKGILKRAKLSDLAPSASKLNIIEQMDGLAVLSYEDSISKLDLDHNITSLRKNENILTAHPFMVSEGHELRMAEPSLRDHVYQAGSLRSICKKLIKMPFGAFWFKRRYTYMPPYVVYTLDRIIVLVPCLYLT